MRVVIVPVLEDNFSYLVVDDSTKQAAAVDPAGPEKVLSAAKAEGVQITTVLTTHRHWDHAGGNETMAASLPGVTIVGGTLDKVPACTKPVQHGDTFTLASSLEVTCLHTPCHTGGHICYYVTDKRTPNEPGAVFTGDTLFVAGCGRFFEGSPADMDHALNGVLAKLPPDTLVYCGHEYSKKNLEFARTVDADNTAVHEKLAWVVEQLRGGRPTVPSTMGQELTYNPFLRVREPALKASAGCTDPVQAMAAIRARKDKF